MPQYSVAVRDGWNDSYETTVGTAPKLQIRSGAAPANCAAADTGTLIVEMSLPSDWMSASSGGVKSLLGTWQATASGSATAGHYRIKNTAGSTTHEQGPVSQAVALTTNALTAANGNVLNFAATTGVVVGMNVSGTGVPAGATVVAVGGTTVTLSLTSTAGVANAASITFNSDITLDNVVINSGQTVTITAKTMTASNA